MSLWSVAMATELPKLGAIYRQRLLGRHFSLATGPFQCLVTMYYGLVLGKMAGCYGEMAWC